MSDYLILALVVAVIVLAGVLAYIALRAMWSALSISQHYRDLERIKMETETGEFLLREARDREAARTGKPRNPKPDDDRIVVKVPGPDLGPEG